MINAELLGPDLVIVIVVLLVLARNLGAAKKEFEKSVKSDDSKSSSDETK